MRLDCDAQSTLPMATARDRSHACGGISDAVAAYTGNTSPSSVRNRTGCSAVVKLVMDGPGGTWQLGLHRRNAKSSEPSFSSTWHGATRAVSNRRFSSGLRMCIHVKREKAGRKRERLTGTTAAVDEAQGTARRGDGRPSASSRHVPYVASACVSVRALAPRTNHRVHCGEHARVGRLHTSYSLDSKRTFTKPRSVKNAAPQLMPE